MNEKIRELAEQANIHFSRVGILDGDPNGSARMVGYSKMEKFAELIVRECAEQVDWVLAEGGKTQGDMLKEHFGVEDRAIPILSADEEAQPETQCKWPTCQNEQYQNRLAEDVLQELYTGRPWTGCGDCDCIFACYGGKTRCIRVATLDYIEKLKTEP